MFIQYIYRLVLKIAIFESLSLVQIMPVYASQ